MQIALYLNGVYEDVLDELLAAQQRHPGPHFLQPYSSNATLVSAAFSALSLGGIY